jgi:hypothetical protein
MEEMMRWKRERGNNSPSDDWNSSHIWVGEGEKIGGKENA